MREQKLSSTLSLFLSQHKTSPQPIKTNCRFLSASVIRNTDLILIAIFWYFLSSCVQLRKPDIWYWRLLMQKFPLKMFTLFLQWVRLQETMTHSEGWALFKGSLTVWDSYFFTTQRKQQFEKKAVSCIFFSGVLIKKDKPEDETAPVLRCLLPRLT